PPRSTLFPYTTLFRRPPGRTSSPAAGKTAARWRWLPRPSERNDDWRCASSRGAPLVEHRAAHVGDQHLDELALLIGRHLLPRVDEGLLGVDDGIVAAPRRRAEE